MSHALWTLQQISLFLESSKLEIKYLLEWKGTMEKGITDLEPWKGTSKLSLSRFQPKPIIILLETIAIAYLSARGG
ncbi:unnamed protein product [Coffea canephora]|uniref:Uncharacterized protein n=1 Tax=Coffea canephora TaxID=49390 RepID=A0A068U4N7_COFCA|nr:unnamed protein product [Coffea canephora]